MGVCGVPLVDPHSLIRPCPERAFVAEFATLDCGTTNNEVGIKPPQEDLLN